MLEKGADTRFVDTSRLEGASDLYDWYVRRGVTEGWIKDFKRALKTDRWSYHRLRPTSFACSYTLQPTGCSMSCEGG